jgi:hypothetical protein
MFAHIHTNQALAASWGSFASYGLRPGERSTVLTQQPHCWDVWQRLVTCFGLAPTSTVANRDDPACSDPRLKRNSKRLGP